MFPDALSRPGRRPAHTSLLRALRDGVDKRVLRRQPPSAVILAPELKGERLDRAVQSALRSAGHEVSVREVRRALEEQQIRVDGRPRAPGERARGGEAVQLGAFVPRLEAVLLPEPALLARAPVLAEDARRLVLDKPSGIPTHPVRAGETGTLLHAAIARAPEIAACGPPLEGGAVHRLDTPTSGVVVFARTPDERARLREAFREHRIEKRYLALVFDPDRRIGSRPVIDAVHIGPGPTRAQVAVLRDARPVHAEQLFAQTTFVRRQTLADGHAWVEATTQYGRRHQVRAQLASLGAPIAGDALYGGPAPAPVPRLALHAAELLLPDGARHRAPVPAELALALAQLGGSTEDDG